MLVIGRVVHAGRQDHDGGVDATGGGDRAQDSEEVVGVVLDGPHDVVIEQEREDLLHHLAILEHVAHAGGRAAVVLEHQITAVSVADQVDSGDVDVDIAGNLQADAISPVAGCPEDELGGNDPILENEPIVIDVMNEKVESTDPLFEPALDPVPFGGGDQPGNRIERDDAFDALLSAVDGEGDTLLAHRQVRQLVAPLELFGAQADQLFDEGCVVGPRRIGRCEHLVVGGQVVAAEQSGLTGTLCRIHLWRTTTFLSPDSIGIQ